MTEINYFQTYSQKENHVTNNTLLMMRHLYRLSPLKLEDMLHSILETDKINLGPSFIQQVRGAHSVPDAVIEQSPLYICIEAKLGNDLTTEQLEAHLESIKEKYANPIPTFLIGLTRDTLDGCTYSNFKESAKKEYGVTFGTTTYEELIQSMKKACEGTPELEEILDDYSNFIASEGLLPDQHKKVVAFLCGTSWAENIKYGVYYEPAERNPKWQQAHLIGTYRNKRITHIGQLKAAAVCETVNGAFKVVSEEFGTLEPHDIEQIKHSISAAQDYYPDFAEEAHRFYVVDQFFETNIIKESAGGMMGHRYFDLLHHFNVLPSNPIEIEEVVKGLQNKTFQ